MKPLSDFVKASPIRQSREGTKLAIGLWTEQDPETAWASIMQRHPSATSFDAEQVGSFVGYAVFGGQ